MMLGPITLVQNVLHYCVADSDNVCQTLTSLSLASFTGCWPSMLVVEGLLSQWQVH